MSASRSSSGPRADHGRGRVFLVAAVGEAAGSRVAAAALACAWSGPDRCGLLIDLGGPSRPRPSLFSTAAARGIEERLAAHVPDRPCASRGSTCHLTLPASAEGAEALGRALPIARDSVGVVHLPPALLDPVLDADGVRPDAALLRADLARDRPLTALAVGALRERGIDALVLKRPLSRVFGRLALAGALGARAAEGLPRRLRPDQAGQALILAIGACFALIAAALALVAIAGAVTGKGRVQRTADLAAISAARSMRDDLPRLLSPPTLPNGLPNPHHLPRLLYLARARAAASLAARANGVGVGRLQVSFPDAAAFAPVRARAVVRATLDAVGGDSVSASAVAEAAAPPTAGAGPAFASGGGYGGPLAYRQGEGMRPDVAASFDRMAAAARSAGVHLIVSSGFRSDAEQAALFAANPDPRMVAPPGRSLHRCATELDLGPASAYGWLAANAGRFGFVQRYSWEAWHYGYESGPAPCSSAGEAVATAGAGRPGDGIAAGAGGLPSFVPAPYRRPLLEAASRWNVSAALLAAQLMAESSFDPYATSPAGAQGIAQFIPSTAAAYGLRDPFDPEQAIEAQAHLMSDLLRQFGSPALALAAYNAGPGAVGACECVPAYPETRAYVSRILALLGGAGALALPAFEVRLVE